MSYLLLHNRHAFVITRFLLGGAVGCGGAGASGSESLQSYNPGVGGGGEAGSSHGLTGERFTSKLGHVLIGRIQFSVGGWPDVVGCRPEAVPGHMGLCPGQPITWQMDL